MSSTPAILPVYRVERWYELLVRLGYDRIYERAKPAQQAAGPPKPRAYQASEAGEDETGAAQTADVAEQVVFVFDVAQMMRDVARGGLLREFVSVVTGVSVEEAADADWNVVAEAVGPFALACSGPLTTLMRLGIGSASEAAEQA